MPNLFASTEGTLPEPNCLLCGINIEITDSIGIPWSIKGASRLDKLHWKRLWKPDPKHCLISAHEVETTFIDTFPLLWSCLYRARKFLTNNLIHSILSDRLISPVIKESNTRYHLTGINSVQSPQGPYCVVNDPKKARITGEKKTDRHSPMFTQFYAADVENQPTRLKGKTIGFVIHAHCWVLLDRSEGLGFNHTNLVQLIRVYRKYWRKNNLWGISADYPEWNVSQSPLIVPAIQQAIVSAKTAYYHTTSGLGILPLELRVLISEFLCPIADYSMNDVQNLKNMLLGLGWELPKSFWRVRLDERLFFELREYSEDPSADWKVRLELMSLVADKRWFVSTGLLNRERILGIMGDLRDVYSK